MRPELDLIAVNFAEGWRQRALKAEAKSEVQHASAQILVRQRDEAEAEVERLKRELELVIAPKEEGGGYEALLKERAEKAEAEVVGLRYKLDHECAALLECQCERERLRAALKALLDYTEQVEQLAYDISEQIEVHPVVAAARAALRGGE